MLQIATGKLFKEAVWRENRLRGVLYTNVQIGYEKEIETTIGKILSTSSIFEQPQVLVYEFIERIEKEANGRNLLISSGADSYLQDFSVVVAFALSCVCTPNVDLCRRLTSGERGISTRVSPNSLIRNFFEKERFCTEEERSFLIDFTKRLIGLPRKKFLGVMRSLRTYVNGMYRVVDDLELAYTLLVASVESLAQDFDEYQSDWQSIDERKRNAIDAALEGAEPAVAQRVREALIASEHASLAKRFREFAISHVNPEYFRQPRSKVGEGALLSRSDLKEALGLAYVARSKYVHQLQSLPHLVAFNPLSGEVAVVERATYLTLQGLSRLMRSVIVEFIYRQKNIESEPYDYMFERTGVLKMRIAPQHWVGRTDGDLSLQGRVRLEGLIDELASCFLKDKDAGITDIRPVLAHISELVPGFELRLRLPYLAIFAIYNNYLLKDRGVPISPIICKLIESDLAKPSSEALLVRTIIGESVPWPLEEHSRIIESYLKRRSAKNGLQFPKIFEVAFILDLAERYRMAGDVEKCRSIVAQAVEHCPGHAGLLDFESKIKMDAPICWSEVILPCSEEDGPVTL